MTDAISGEEFEVLEIVYYSSSVARGCYALLLLNFNKLVLTINIATLPEIVFYPRTSNDRTLI